jgi:hypothetical protein
MKFGFQVLRNANLAVDVVPIGKSIDSLLIQIIAIAILDWD